MIAKRKNTPEIMNVSMIERYVNEMNLTFIIEMTSSKDDDTFIQ